MGNTLHPEMQDWRTMLTSLPSDPRYEHLQLLKNVNGELLLARQVELPEHIGLDQLKKRISNRQTGAFGSSFVFPLSQCYFQHTSTLCSQQQRCLLTCPKPANNLEKSFEERRQARMSFSSDQINLVLNNVSKAINSIFEAGQPFCPLRMSHIAITDNAYLIDPILLQTGPFGFGSIGDFPAPQTLTQDGIQLFKDSKLAIQLFSLGIIGLQLYHTGINIKDIYMRYHKYGSITHVNTQRLNELTNAISDHYLRAKISTLTNSNPQIRKNIVHFIQKQASNQANAKQISEQFANRHLPALQTYSPILKSIGNVTPVLKELKQENNKPVSPSLKHPHLQNQEIQNKPKVSINFVSKIHNTNTVQPNHAENIPKQIPVNQSNIPQPRNSRKNQQNFNEQTPLRPQKRRNFSTIKEVSEYDECASTSRMKFLYDDPQSNGRYEGQLKRGMKNGYGTLYFPQGSIYEGEWKDDQMHGFGRLYYPSGKIAYQGSWRNNEFSGHGKVYNDLPKEMNHPFEFTDFNQLGEEWIYYEGNLYQDQRQGQGILLLSNGQQLLGEFSEDKVHGSCKFHTMSGKVICGLWCESILQRTFNQ